MKRGRDENHAHACWESWQPTTGKLCLQKHRVTSVRRIITRSFRASWQHLSLRLVVASRGSVSRSGCSDWRHPISFLQHAGDFTTSVLSGLAYARVHSVLRRPHKCMTRIRCRAVELAWHRTTCVASTAVKIARWRSGSESSSTLDSCVVRASEWRQLRAFCGKYHCGVPAEKDAFYCNVASPAAQKAPASIFFIFRISFPWQRKKKSSTSFDIAEY